MSTMLFKSVTLTWVYFLCQYFFDCCFLFQQVFLKIVYQSHALPSYINFYIKLLIYYTTRYICNFIFCFFAFCHSIVCFIYNTTLCFLSNVGSSSIDFHSFRFLCSSVVLFCFCPCIHIQMSITFLRPASLPFRSVSRCYHTLSVHSHTCFIKSITPFISCVSLYRMSHYSTVSTSSDSQHSTSYLLQI